MRITLRNVPPTLMDFLFIPCSKWETMDSQNSIWHWSETRRMSGGSTSKSTVHQMDAWLVKFIFNRREFFKRNRRISREW